ncbi:hypothetical protein J6TS2_20930 [Heyndrickxia sporothermodurans]|nr:hypothetical protein J6TS2_20930 [Heyndrickxia sporothermodurans]
MSIKKKLQRFKKHLGHKEKSPLLTNPPVVDNEETTIISDIPYLDMWEKENTRLYTFDNEYCFIREVRYPLDHLHGKYYFQDFLKAVQMWNSGSVMHPLSATGFRPEDLFFFDTETTGLGGGTGNTIFLLGYASVINEEIVLKQHVLPEPGLEIPLYYSFLENIDYSTLVTYNGKAFDWPQVKTRHTLIREHVPRLPSFGHFDLYHASRRFWKDRLDSVKLINIEKEILDFNRKDDIPGYLAPMIYFDFVERKNPEGLIKILKHNENDILSLISLYTHLTFQILQQDPRQTSTEKVHLGKWFQYIGEQEAAFKTFQTAANANDIQGKYELAYHYKKQKNFLEAKALWVEVVKTGEGKIQKLACIEVAKILEHQEKNYYLAKEFTEKAIHIHVQHQCKSPTDSDKFLQEAQKRLLRLQRK